MMARTEVHLIEIQAPNLPLFATVEVGTAKANVWINLFIVQAASASTSSYRPGVHERGRPRCPGSVSGLLRAAS